MLVRAPAVGFDPVSGRLIAFGGWTGVTPNPRYLKETYSLAPDENGTWRELVEAGGPQPQEGAVMTYAPGVGLLLVAESGRGTGVWVMRTGAEKWTPLPLPSTWAPSNRKSLTWMSESCQLFVWESSCGGAAQLVRFGPGAPLTALSVSPVAYPGALTKTVFANTTWDSRRKEVVVQGGYDCNVSKFLDVTESFELK